MPSVSALHARHVLRRVRIPSLPLNLSPSTGPHGREVLRTKHLVTHPRDRLVSRPVRVLNCERHVYRRRILRGLRRAQRTSRPGSWYVTHRGSGALMYVKISMATYLSNRVPTDRRSPNLIPQETARVTEHTNFTGTSRAM